MVLETQISTAAELLRMPHDGWRYELVRGELRKMAPASYQHGRIAALLSGRLLQYVEAHELGDIFAAETGFLIGSQPDTVRAPDVGFVRRDRIEAVRPAEGYWRGAPDLAVEVISPGDTYTEVEEKVFDWLDAGTRLVLVVNPRKRTVTSYRSRTEIAVLTEQDSLDGADVVPGWTLPVRALFA